MIGKRERKSLEKKIVFTALQEDLFPKGDITSNCLISKKLKSTFQLIANEDCILAGLQFFQDTFKLINKDIVVKSTFKDGDNIKNKQVVAVVKGCTRDILKGERTALNFVSHLSGIATTTKELVKLIEHKKVVLLDTRKTTPILRLLEKQAIVSGGGKNHRFSLSDMVLIKDNHISPAGGIKKAINKARKFCKDKKNKIKIEIEVNSLKELKDAISSKPNIIMFDNWSVKNLRKAVKLVPQNILTEASGKITKENIKQYAKTGVNYISTSYMIKNSKWVDFSMDLVE